MLKQRIFTAIVLLLIVVGAILGLPYLLFEAFLAIVVALAAWEWSLLSGFKTALGRALYTSLVILGICLGISLDGIALQSLFVLNMLWWGFALACIYCYPKLSSLWENKSFTAAAGFFILYPCFMAIMVLRSQTEYIFHILLLLALVAAADIGAYFSGRSFGKHKLAPKVSPNKTWEGVWGGMLACCLLVLIVIFSLQGSVGSWGFWPRLIVCAVLISVFSVVGDLTESMLKRIKGIKDSGNILPGHGGILDRIDGLVAAGPVYAFLLIKFGS